MIVRTSCLAFSAAALLALPLVAQEMTVEELVAKNLEARGGRAAIEAVDSALISGKMTMQGMEVPVVLKWKRPEMVRMEMTLQGQTGVQAYDGAVAWMHMPFMGKTAPERMPDEMVDDMEEMADFDGPLVDWQEKGHQVELLGKEEVEGTEAYKLKLTKKNGSETVIYLDADHFLEIKQASTRKMGDQEISTETSIGNYKQVGALVLPHSMEIRPTNAPAGAPGQSIVIDSYQLGAEISAADFAFPTPAEAPEGP